MPKGIQDEILAVLRTDGPLSWEGLKNEFSDVSRGDFNIHLLELVAAKKIVWPESGLIDLYGIAYANDRPDKPDDTYTNELEPDHFAACIRPTNSKNR